MDRRLLSVRGLTGKFALGLSAFEIRGRWTDFVACSRMFRLRRSRSTTEKVQASQSDSESSKSESKVSKLHTIVCLVAAS